MDTEKRSHKSSKMVVCKRCGKLRLHHAHGLCISCYQEVYGINRKRGFCADPECPRFGEEVELVARGLCSSCYIRNMRNGTLHLYPLTRTG